MQDIAIIGATGGIGHALLDWCGTRWPEARIWASTRDVADSNQPHPAGATVQWLPLDLQINPSIEAFSQHLLNSTDQLDLLLICSGWLHDAEHMPEKSVRDLNAGMLDKALRINATAPLLLMAQLTPLLTRPTANNRDPARVLALSAKVGSINDNSLGGWHAYRMSKAALNMGVRNLGIEFARSKRRPLIAAVHPGTTHTPLSEPFAKRGLDVVSADVTAERLGHFVCNMNETHQGGLYHWDGSTIAW